VLTAAVHAKKESLAFQQLAVSHAAHNALIWLFHGTRNYNAVDASLRAIIPQIGLDPKSDAGKKAVSLGRAAAAKVAKARADDGLNDFVDYVYGNKTPGVYQTTPGGNPIPDTPQAPFVRPWAGLGDITPFRGPPPLPISDPKYEADVLELKEIGAQNSTKRTAYQTDTAYFWRESSITCVPPPPLPPSLPPKACATNARNATGDGTGSRTPSSGASSRPTCPLVPSSTRSSTTRSPTRRLRGGPPSTRTRRGAR